MSKIGDYEYSRKTKYFFSFSNSEGTIKKNAHDFEVLCNNNLLTNAQSTGNKPVNLLFNPITCTLDLKYFNVSETLLNNKIRVTSTMFANSPVIVTIPNGFYNVISLAAALQAALISSVIYDTASPNLPGWLVEVVNATQLKISFTAATSGTSAATTIEFSDFNDTDSRSVLGFSTKVVTIAYASRVTGVTGPLAVDLQPYDTLRVCSRLAKRFYTMQNGVLSNSDVLFEIPLISYQLGQVVKFESVDTTLEQEIQPDFSTFDIKIRDKKGNIIEFDSTAQLHINFSLTREIYFQSPEEKLKNIANYASYIS